ncbi:phospholipase D-like domain-containing protein [Aliifodinibius salicampi]|uniref:Phospholipase D-like domain-containing protein n=1 Tax=Fodinibius salicampi TaxID=1920655 RepID=A0ABT3PWC8_9BACT|nr:phospholipase D-like domain-containing protein [Fodinibius salicampi]MCW9712164.1 phospholipase D-like domain-containing protein [Fodinibius salicampi]
MDYKETLEATVGVPFSQGNAVKVLKNGDEIFPAMLKAIKAAEHQVDFLTFVYWEGNIADRFARILAKKAEEGLEVRVILDSFGAAFMPEELVALMETSGVEVEWFRPFKQWKVWKSDNRTHRKVLICDGCVAFTGGVGIAEEWEGDARNPSEWRETHFRIEGPAVKGLQSAFLENWIEAGRNLKIGLPWHENNGKTPLPDDHSIQDIPLQVVRTSASVRWSDIVILYKTLIQMAQESIFITTAYFNPNKPMVQRLCDAAKRGVNVQIMMPGKHMDKRVANIAGGDHFNDLLDAGVTLWQYQKTMLHSKIIVIDDFVSCIGSANFNHRSMLKDDEVNLVALSEELAETLVTHFNEDLEHCEEVKGETWKRRNVFRRALEGLSRPFKQQI